MDTVETDILVIGGGGAGAYAAYEASKRGGSITLVAKGFLGRSGSTPMALGAIAGVGPWKQPQDSKDVHFMDTLKGGAFLNEGRLARIMVEESPKRILELEELGAFWERSDDGEAYLLRQGGGHSFPRSPYVEDRPGHELLKVLKGELLRRNVRLMENQMVLKILTNDGRVCGAISMGVHTGEFTLYKAKAIVLATGGASQIYPYFTQDVRNTGDGFCLGIEAGADLMDMEFLQFFLGLSWPEALRGIIVGALYYGRLFNGEGERFLQRYDPERLEFSTRDIVSRACFQEMQEGRGTPHGGIYMDLSHNPPGFVKEKLPMVHSLCEQLGMDLERGPVEVAPTFHFVMGGIRVDESWQSGVQGFFAAGEAAGGVHGANRLSQNSLADVAVSGAISGESAVAYAEGRTFLPIDHAEYGTVCRKVEELSERAPTHPLRLSAFKENLRNLMWEKVSFRRDERGLGEALDEVCRIRQEDLSRLPLTTRSKRFNRELIEILEMENLLTFSELVIRSAQVRKESRGAHFREDHPEQDDENWLKHVVIGKIGGEYQLRTVEVDLNENRPAP